MQYISTKENIEKTKIYAKPLIKYNETDLNEYTFLEKNQNLKTKIYSQFSSENNDFLPKIVTVFLFYPFQKAFFFSFFLRFLLSTFGET